MIIWFTNRFYAYAFFKRQIHIRYDTNSQIYDMMEGWGDSEVEVDSYYELELQLIANITK